MFRYVIDLYQMCLIGTHFAKLRSSSDKPAWGRSSSMDRLASGQAFAAVLRL